MKTEASVVGVPFRAPWALSPPHDSAGTQEIALPMGFPGSLRVCLGVRTAWQAAAFSPPSLRVLCLGPPRGQGFPTWQSSGRVPRVTGGPFPLPYLPGSNIPQGTRLCGHRWWPRQNRL